jgi:hypothetical protein
LMRLGAPMPSHMQPVVALFIFKRKLGQTTDTKPMEKPFVKLLLERQEDERAHCCCDWCQSRHWL